MKTGRGYSGSTGWNNSSRARMTFTAHTKGDDDGDGEANDLRKLESVQKTNWPARRDQNLALA